MSDEKSRLIFHVDVNSAFLSWSALKQLQEDPDSVDLRTIPSAVGGDIQTRHGVITAKSIPAKKYGVQTGEAVVKALQKCPHLVLVRSDFTTYRKYSRQFIAILETYSDAVEQVSIDEAYMDMTGTEQLFGDSVQDGLPFPYCVAQKIRDEIRETLGFTVNVGISSNKLLAKMASDFEKPDKTHTLFPSEVPEKLWPLPIRELHGCGAATSKKLETLGLYTIGDVARTSQKLLQSILGEKAGEYIWKSCNGISESPVHTEQEKAKSYSNETTTAVDISRENLKEYMPDFLHRLSEKVSSRMIRDQIRAKTIGVIVKTGNFQRHTRQETLPVSVNDCKTIEETAIRLMNQLLLGEDGLFAKGEVLRLVGISAANLDDGAYRQISLMDWMQEAPQVTAEVRQRKVRSEKLDNMMKEINNRYGKDAVFQGNKN